MLPRYNLAYSSGSSIASALHAKEKKWLGTLIMVRPITDSVEISHMIKSKSSDGMLSGKLTKAVE